MNYERNAQDIKELRARNGRLGMMLFGLTFVLLIAVACIFKLIGSERTIIVPPSISKTFWVSAQHVSNDYLEEMGAFSAWLILDVTPGSIDWKRQTLLQYASPDGSGALKMRQEVEAERLKKLNGSTFFALQQIIPDEAKLTVRLVGQFHTQINGVETSAVDKVFLAQFEYRGGRIHLKSFLEAENGK